MPKLSACVSVKSESLKVEGKNMGRENLMPQ